MSHPAENDAAHPVLDDEVGQSYAEALEVEKAGYEARCLPGRAAQVEAELARIRGDAPGAAGELETAEDIGQLETAAPPKAKRARKS